MRKGTKIASIESVKSVASCYRYIPTQVTGDHNRTAQKPRSLEVLEEFHQEYGFKISPDLEPDKRRELLQLLYDYKEIFARSLTEIKRYPGYQLEIELLSNRKVFKRNYRFLPQDAEIAEKNNGNVRCRSYRTEYICRCKQPDFPGQQKGQFKTFGH